MVFQICSSGPFVVLLLMGGFGVVFPLRVLPTGIGGSGGIFSPPVLGIPERTQSERQEVAWGMLVHVCLEPSGTNLASPAVPVEI